jgi:hypothetical protein
VEVLMAAVTKAQIKALAPLSMFQRGEYAAVTPSDSVDLPLGPCQGLNVAGAGTASIVGLAGQDPVTVTLTEGWNPCPCVRVRATGTTATSIVAVY